MAGMLAALLLGLMPTPASAHALVVRTAPAAGNVGSTDVPPRRVSIWFSEPVDVAFNGVAVLDSDGRRVDKLDARIATDDSSRVDVSVDDLQPGAFLVRWRVTSLDNHIVGGTFWFAIGFATTIPAAALAGADVPSLATLEAIARWFALMSTLVLAGAPFFLVLVIRPVAKRLDRAEFQRIIEHSLPRLIHLWVAALAMFLVAHVLWAAAQADAVAEQPLPRAFAGPVLGSVLFASRFAVLWWTRLLFGLFLAGVLLVPESRRRMPGGRGAPAAACVMSVGLLCGVALGGHAAGARFLPTLAVPIDIIHLGAAAIWLGGLAQLAVILAVVLKGPTAIRDRALPFLVARVSGVALVSVVVLAVTGAFSAWEQTGTLPGLASTVYGQTLLAKLGLLVPLLAIAAVNLLVIRPRLARRQIDDQPSGLLTRRFRLLVRNELGFGVCVLLVTAVLTSLPPPGPQALPESIQVARQLGDLRVELTVDPNWVGVSRFQVVLTDAQGRAPVDVHDVSLTFAMEGMNMGRTTVRPMSQAPGVYAGDGFYIGMPGASLIGVAISRSSAAEQSTVFRVETPNIRETQFQGLGPSLASLANTGVPIDRATIARGQAAYQSYCGICHGDTGIGNGPAAASLVPPPADLTLHARWHPDEQLFWFITHGVAGTPMPSFEAELTPTERWDIIGYLHTLAAAPTASAPREAPPTPRPTSPPSAAVPASTTTTATTTTTEPLGGRLVFGPDSDKDFWIWQFPSSAPERVTQFSRLDFASYPVWSTDGQRVAFSFYTLPRVGAIPGGTDVYVMDGDGSNIRPLAAHDTPGAALLHPAWAPDGKAVYVTHQARAAGGGTATRIDRVEVPSAGSATVIQNAAYPSPSRDGRLLAYVAMPNPDGSGQSLWVAAADGAEPRQVLPAGLFVRFSSVHFSPDGTKILFAAVGQGTATAPRPIGLFDPAALLNTLLPSPVAYADGEEWDLWTIQPDGSKLQRLTSIAEDLPVASWSPGGGHIAFLGGGSARTAETGLAVITADGGELRRLTTRPGHRGADWSPLR